MRVTVKSFYDKKVLVLSFVQLPGDFLNSLQNIPNCGVTYYNDNDDFVDKIAIADKIVLISKVGITDTYSYKIVRKAINNQQKEIITDILI